MKKSKGFFLLQNVLIFGLCCVLLSCTALALARCLALYRQSVALQECMQAAQQSLAGEAVHLQIERKVSRQQGMQLLELGAA